MNNKIIAINVIKEPGYLGAHDLAEVKYDDGRALTIIVDGRVKGAKIEPYARRTAKLWEDLVKAREATWAAEGASWIKYFITPAPDGELEEKVLEQLEQYAVLDPETAMNLDLRGAEHTLRNVINILGQKYFSEKLPEMINVEKLPEMTGGDVKKDILWTAGLNAAENIAYARVLNKLRKISPDGIFRQEI